MPQQIRSNKLLPAATTEKLFLNDTPSLPSVVTGIVQICRYNKIVDAKTIEKTFNLLSNLDSAPLPDKLLLTLSPYAYGEDVILDDLYGNTGEDVVIEWRGRYGEDVPIMGYMITGDMQTEMFALLGEGLWFDAEGIAKQVNNIELAQSDEINVDGVWYRLDYAAGVGRREVYFYDTATLTSDDIAVIAAWFKVEVVPPTAKMFVPIRRNRTSKPPIGTPLRSDGHWSVQGLLLAFPFNEFGGKRAHNNAYPPSTDGGVYGDAVLNDKGLYCAGINGSAMITASQRLGVPTGSFDPWTVITNVTTKNAANEDIIFGASARFILTYASDGKLYSVRMGNVNAVSVSESVVFTSGVAATVASCFNGSTIDLYHNGKECAYNPARTAVDTPYGTRGNNWAIGSRYDLSGNFWDGEIAWLLYYQCYLSPQQIASLSANPWQIYEPETVWVEI